jgi:hypothetical protein
MKQLLYFVTIICIFFSGSAFQPKSDQLILVCAQNDTVSADDIQISVRYENHGSDTLALPVKYLNFNNYQKLRLNDTSDFFCTTSVKMVWGTSDEQPCNFHLLETTGFKFIEPGGSLTIRFKIDEMGCVGRKFLRGEKVSYNIRLDIDERFRNWCDAVWTGQTAPVHGSFVVK